MHSRGGVCSIHGAGAKHKWKLSDKRMSDRRKSREYFHVCDEGVSNRKLMKTRLMFDRMTSPEVTRTRNHGE